MSLIKNALLVLLLSLIAFGSVQKQFGLIRSKPLNGVFPVTSPPAFSCSTWMAGSYQEQYRTSLEDSVGFKSDLIRIYNQFDYSLFSIPHASKVVVGKESYLFADTYIFGAMGTDFVGKYYVEQKVKRVRFLQDFLWSEKGILLIVAYAPGKGYYYPEYIPDRFYKEKKAVTNYEYFAQECLNQGVNTIDFNRWLLLMKDTSRFVLYPKTGIHWSSYGACLCADSLRKYIEVKLNRKLPRLVLDSFEISSFARDEDNDIEKTMNLIWRIPQPQMAYPKFHFTYDSLQPKPKTLFVGDSFFWYWYYNGIIDNTFSKTAFWYYNQEVYPQHFTTPTNTGNLNFRDSILNQQVIVLLQTNGAYGDLGYGWVDRAYDYLYPGPTHEKDIEAKMQASPAWMDALARKAKERGISVDAMSRLDAIFMVNQEIKRIHKK